MAKKIAFLLVFLLVLSLPFLLRDKNRAIDVGADDTLVVLTGHNENVRSEIAMGFQRWYREKTGRTVFIDWRFIGGMVESIRYLESSYLGAFRYHYEHVLGKPWTAEVQQIFSLRTADRSRWRTPAHVEVLGTFYDSSISVGIDLFFGGGVTEYVLQKDRGSLVDSGFLREHPEIFNEECIPQRFAGENVYDPDGYWFGQVLSTFGILLNEKALADRGFAPKSISQWKQLTDGRLFGAIALVDPTKSSALLKAYEMVVQQQISESFAELSKNSPGGDSAQMEREAVADGWLRGLRILQLMSANTRYYADAPTKMILDVSGGNSAVGVIVDFMGNAQAAFDHRRCGWERLQFIVPKNGSAVSPDPIAVLRGAPHMEVTKLFLEFLLGEDGQKLMVFSLGSPGGPVRNEPLRPAVNKKVYAEENASHMASLANPYMELRECEFHPERTAPFYNVLKWVVKCAFMIPHGELVDAWRAILRARTEGRTEAADAAMVVLQDFSSFGADEVHATLDAVLHLSSPAQSLEVQRLVVQRFQQQYRRAQRIADGKK
ncbi:MAG: extracellular solute-binding protein [Puniceicoccales bacterium]|jgi:ABC-type Fe3+ transport system substrate-binding protein|nr:extracellular solute-binding protein [Puniceicoccales bacterium]